jgi:phytanoyl-CoA hydroxylase
MRNLTSLWEGIARRLPLVGKEKVRLSEQELNFWHHNGFVILPGLFTHDAIDEVNSYLEKLWFDEQKQDSDIVVDVFVGTDREKRTHLKNAPGDARYFPFKINDLFLESNLVRDLVLSDQLEPILRALLQGTPMICNTLNFTYGSQQDFHTDSLYMPAPVDLNLIATWIALEDCDPDAGPLQYYPGSHSIPPFRFSHGGLNANVNEMKDYSAYMKSAVESRGLKPERFCARKGDVLIWHSQLYHGGSSIKNMQKSRKSLVTHYWRSVDCPNLEQKPAGKGMYWHRHRQPVIS